MDRTSPRPLVLLWFSALAVAQEPVRPAPSPAAPPLEITRQFGCVDDRGPEVLALGRGWRAAFTAGAVEFRPALGNAAARAWPLRLELASIRRGDAVTGAAALPAERRVDRTARTVDFVRPGSSNATAHCRKASSSRSRSRRRRAARVTSSSRCRSRPICPWAPRHRTDSSGAKPAPAG